MQVTALVDAVSELAQSILGTRLYELLLSFLPKVSIMHVHPHLIKPAADYEDAAVATIIYIKRMCKVWVPSNENMYHVIYSNASKGQLWKCTE